MQGFTVYKAVMSLGPNICAPGKTYLAVGRVSSHNSLRHASWNVENCQLKCLQRSSSRGDGMFAPTTTLKIKLINQCSFSIQMS